jgi:phosphohistidine phosphatase
MKRVWLVRHAIAVERSAPGLPDEDRPLTGPGRERFRRAAKGLARLGVSPDLLVSSPLLRATQTAEELAKVLHLAAALRCEGLAPGGTSAQVLAFLENAGRWREAILVGHMPGLGTLLADLVGGGSGLRVDFRKGGAALVDFDSSLRAGGGTLRSLLTPKALRALAKG